MIHIRIFREEADRIRKDHDRRGLPHSAIEEVIQLDIEWRDTRSKADEMRKMRNRAARRIGEAKKVGDKEEEEKILTEVADLGAKIGEIGKKADHLEGERDAIRMRIPNILHGDVPIGENDEENHEKSLHGRKPEFDFKPRSHNELIELNGWVDQPRAVKIGGSRFYFLKGDLARLEIALQTFAVDWLRNKKYTFVQPPIMMNKRAYEGVTDLSDFENVMYGIQPDGYHLIATSEHPLTAMFMEEVIEPSLLPIRMVGLSPCFRREVGAHGLSDRGIWRVHQFTKVEQVIISHPDESWKCHEELLKNTQKIWDSLGIHYRVVDICTGDMGTIAARKYDLEAWLPGAGSFKEVVSCSNCTDYQANRLKMRFRTSDGNKSVHTLNSTAIATSRALVAIMEQYQLQDGKVRIPDVLIPLMNGRSILEPSGW